TFVVLKESDNYSMQLVNKGVITPKTTQIETTLELGAEYQGIEQYSFTKELDYQLLNSAFVMQNHYEQVQPMVISAQTFGFTVLQQSVYDGAVELPLLAGHYLPSVGMNYSDFRSFDASLVIGESDEELYEYWIEDIAI
ncbi:hypothetical protein KJ942_08670, partial [bacterium]|nr:hypothetical protein [bacterium]